MMRATVDRRHGGRGNGAPAARTPTAGRHADLLRLASSIGNRRMAAIARQPWPWYGPPIGVEEEEEEDLANLAAPPGLDLSFLDERHAEVSDIPAPSPMRASITAGPQPGAAILTELPKAQHAQVIPAPQPPAPVVVPAVAPAAAPARNPANEIAPLTAEGSIKQLTRKVDELMGANLVTVTASAPFRLGNPRKPNEMRGMLTLEVVITVKARAGGAQLVQFVAHYHPTAEKAKPGSTAASQMHIKKHAHAQKYNRDEVAHGSHPHLNKVVPKFGPTGKNWESLPVDWGLNG